MIIYILEKAFEKLRGKELDFIITESSNLNNRMTTKKEKKSNPKFSRMDDTELSDIKLFFKNLYYDDKGVLKYDKNFDPYEDDEKKPFLKINHRQQDYNNNYNNINNFSGNRLSKATRVKESFGSSFYQSYASEKKSIDGNVAVGIEDLEEEEIEEEEECEDAIKIKSAELLDFNFICCIGKGKNSKTYIAKSEKYGVVYAIS